MSEVAPLPEDVRPVVRTAAASNLGPWVFGAILLLGGALLFGALSARRESLAVPVTQTSAGSGETISAPPPLTLGEAYPERAFAPFPRAMPFPSPAPPPATFPAQAVTRVAPPPAQTSGNGFAPPGMTRGDFPVSAPAPALAPPPIPLAPPAAPAPTFDPEERVSAARLANPAFTVPKGTIVAAVLETALDSTRPGAARAVVSRDVKSFDGGRVLIPRGSRLYGEYGADVTSGQNRALITWQRLLRPDGVTIDLASPSADPLGRAGVAGQVNTHFFARFGSAILQSVLDIGVGLATRRLADDAVIVALPGSTQQITGQAQQAQVQPTLRVRHGTSVSVFVARDLDFSTVDR